MMNRLPYLTEQGLLRDDATAADMCDRALRLTMVEELMAAGYSMADAERMAREAPQAECTAPAIPIAFHQKSTRRQIASRCG